ncbi:amidohydrolase family protein [Sphingomonas glacialis]|uniref:Amidohydrolase n=1 Tax=Sphingomonas glacialis TaxID=658225 RepID=A0A502FZN2_9SPHN|nr:amidohydrolase family protein [Sphingomonas glacialis]TPG55028.1 amidohydrolase [Sphingomonas glacialis]
MTKRFLCTLAVGAAGIALIGARAPISAQGTTAIVGAVVFDATGAPPHPATVLIEGDRIVAVGPDLKVPAGAKVIDATGEALLPGFYDLHTHWTPSGDPGVTPAIASAYVAAGVTTSNDFNSAPEAFEARRRWLASLAVAPHVNLCGRLSTPGGHGADWADTATTKMIVTPQSARAGVDQILPYKPDCLGEVMTDGWRYGLSPDNTSMNEDALTALVDEAHKSNIPVLTHTLRTEKGAEAGRAKVDVIAHALQDLPLTDQQVATIRAGGSAFAPTLAVYDPSKPGHRTAPGADEARRVRAAANWSNARSNTKKLYDAGVPVVSGTDAGMPGTPHGIAVLRELELLVQAGLPPAGALTAATANSARVMHQLDDRGTIETGKRADLVLIKGTPWKTIGDVEKIDRVLVDGRLVYGPGAPPPNPVQPMPAVAVGPLVDDFERTDGRSNLDTLVVTDPDGGIERSVEVIDIVSREDGGHALSMIGRMAVKPDPQIAIVLPLTKGAIQPADLRRYHGIKVELRGVGSYEVALNTLSGTYAAAVSAGTKWQTIEVPFDSLKKDRGRVEFPTEGWTGSDVLSLEIKAKRKSGETAWLMLDTVRFY